MTYKYKIFNGRAGQHQLFSLLRSAIAHHLRKVQYLFILATFHYLCTLCEDQTQLLPLCFLCWKLVYILDKSWLVTLHSHPKKRFIDGWKQCKVMEFRNLLFVTKSSTCIKLSNRKYYDSKMMDKSSGLVHMQFTNHYKIFEILIFYTKSVSWPNLYFYNLDKL